MRTLATVLLTSFNFRIVFFSMFLLSFLWGGDYNSEGNASFMQYQASKIVNNTDFDNSSKQTGLVKTSHIYEK